MVPKPFQYADKRSVIFHYLRRRLFFYAFEDGIQAMVLKCRAKGIVQSSCAVKKYFFDIVCKSALNL